MTEAELIAMSLGIYVDPDAELCRRQREETAVGIIKATLARNMYGFCVRDTYNDGAGNMSGNFKTLAEAMAWASAWIVEDPAKHILVDTIIR
jgi:hypothetical protein